MERLVCYFLGPFGFDQLFQGKCLGLAEVLETLGVALDGHGVLFAEPGLVGWFFVEGAEESDIGHFVGRVFRVLGDALGVGLDPDRDVLGVGFSFEAIGVVDLGGHDALVGLVGVGVDYFMEHLVAVDAGDNLLDQLLEGRRVVLVVMGPQQFIFEGAVLHYY